MRLASACLCGFVCAYDGKDKTIDKLREEFLKGEIIPICPEQMGGLATPREACEIIDGRVFNKSGIDMTENFLRGAKYTLEMASSLGITEAVLKSRSPSCGSNIIYDGTFSGNKIAGDGFSARLLKDNKIKVYTEEEYCNKIESDICHP
ncbi:MAG: DUF523 domain-containing protein [Candidatus Delongbacteria bacterium]|nr:DUF523 domain-containing protein [Candidatus Delongbacteria bacterium]MBN2835637.1 DUF523 domain-containing protein [Candidatus Delongbacteria bacterium]